MQPLGECSIELRLQRTERTNNNVFTCNSLCLYYIWKHNAPLNFHCVIHFVSCIETDFQRHLQLLFGYMLLSKIDTLFWLVWLYCRADECEWVCVCRKVVVGDFFCWSKRRGKYISCILCCDFICTMSSWVRERTHMQAIVLAVWGNSYLYFTGDCSWFIAWGCKKAFIHSRGIEFLGMRLKSKGITTSCFPLQQSQYLFVREREWQWDLWDRSKLRLPPALTYTANDTPSTIVLCMDISAYSVYWCISWLSPLPHKCPYH